MRFVNDNTRQLALAWWRGLTRAEKFRFAHKFYKDRPFEFVSTSSSAIENIYKQINNGQRT